MLACTPHGNPERHDMANKVEKKRYQRTVPSGRTRLARVAVEGRLLEDVILGLKAYNERTNAGTLRTYIDRDGDVVITVEDWKA